MAFLGPFLPVWEKLPTVQLRHQVWFLRISPLLVQDQARVDSTTDTREHIIFS